MPDTHFYRYDDYDRTLIAERVEQFRDQVRRRLAGELTEEQFKPLRLTNGLYLQLHAYMLRIAIPYGTLSSRQLRKLAEIARRYDRGYGHFTTPTNFIISRLNAARSNGHLEVTRFPSTTTSLSSQIPPAFLISSGTPSCQ